MCSLLSYDGTTGKYGSTRKDVEVKKRWKLMRGNIFIGAALVPKDSPLCGGASRA